jgi:hypothetical protein
MDPAQREGRIQTVCPLILTAVVVEAAESEPARTVTISRTYESNPSGTEAGLTTVGSLYRQPGPPAKVGLALAGAHGGFPA